MKYTIKGFAVANCRNELTFTGLTEKYSREFLEHLNSTEDTEKPYQLIFVDTTIEID